MSQAVLKPRHPALLTLGRDGEQELVDVVVLGTGPDNGRVNVQPRWGSQSERRWVDTDDVTMLSELLDEAIESAGTERLTFLPKPSVLRDLGFTDYSKDRWYLSASIAPGLTFDVTIPKDPVAFVASEPIYSYNEMVIDSDFGQVAHYGQMPAAIRETVLRRVSSTIGRLDDAGISIESYPAQYGWAGWPQDEPLSGDPFADSQRSRQLTTKSR